MVLEAIRETGGISLALPVGRKSASGSDANCFTNSNCMAVRGEGAHYIKKKFFSGAHRAMAQHLSISRCAPSHPKKAPFLLYSLCI